MFVESAKDRLSVFGACPDDLAHNIVAVCNMPTFFSADSNATGPRTLMSPQIGCSGDSTLGIKFVRAVKCNILAVADPCLLASRLRIPTSEICRALGSWPVSSFRSRTQRWLGDQHGPTTTCSKPRMESRPLPYSARESRV